MLGVIWRIEGEAHADAHSPTLSVLTDSRSQFVIEPLEPGFGYTLGNSLRRLLSSIPRRPSQHSHRWCTPRKIHHGAGSEDVSGSSTRSQSLVVSSGGRAGHHVPTQQGPGEVTAGDIVPLGPASPCTTRHAHAR